MSQFTSGTGKWFLGFVFSLYGFILSSVIGGIVWSLGGTSIILWASVFGCVGFYFIFVLSWYKKKEEIYRVANLSHWCDNITFLNDKGTVSIRQDRITEIIDLNASVDDILKITKKDPEFLRIKVALISDARKTKDEPGYDVVSADDDTNVDEVLNDIRELDERKLAYIANGDRDPLQFKYKYFRIVNIIKPHMEWIPMVTRREIDDDDEIPIPKEKFEVKEPKATPDQKQALIDKISSLQNELRVVKEKVDASQKDLENMPKGSKPKDHTAKKKEIVDLISRETGLEAEINDLQLNLKNKKYTDVLDAPDKKAEKPGIGPIVPETDEETVDDSGDEDDGDVKEGGEIKLEEGTGEADDSIEVVDDDSGGAEDDLSPSPEIEEETSVVDFDDDQETMLETYKKVSRVGTHRILGRFGDFVDRCRKKGNEAQAYDKNIYRSFLVDEILKVLEKNSIHTIEDIRNCDKIKIAKQIGFTADEMKEFVKYCEDETKKKTVQFYKDLIPKEIRQFNLIKVAHVQQKAPEKFVYLITYAEPIELVFPKKVIALSYADVKPKPKLKDERIQIDIRMFEQAVYELPDKIESCMKFIPGQNASLFDYPVIVPLTYATFVLKGWMGTNIPIFKAIATSYDVNREMDDYKHYLSHEHVLVKAMVGYVNHIKSNTNLSSQHIEYTQQELDNMKDELEDQRQLRLRQIYFRSGGMAAPDVIDKMWGSQQQPQEQQKKKSPVGIIATIIVALVAVIFVMMFLK